MYVSAGPVIMKYDIKGNTDSRNLLMGTCICERNILIKKLLEH